MRAEKAPHRSEGKAARDIERDKAALEGTDGAREQKAKKGQERALHTHEAHTQAALQRRRPLNERRHGVALA